MRIKQLSPNVANQIAAGEVIEQPASIVKELLDNAVDAKATAINIEIGHGGLNQIKVSDDGIGIMAEDLPLAIAPHATSKITTLNDLYTLTSMGFRGEALASIASVSRLAISSKTATQEKGMRLEYANEQVSLSPVARQQGTTVDVKDIFFNTPVRKKFLKTDKLEYLAIELVIKRFALGNPTIAIQVSHNNKMMLNLPAAHEEPLQHLRMIKLLGKAFMAQAIVVNTSHAKLNLYGWLSGPAYQRSQSDRFWLYINGRVVKDKLITHAIKQAYEGLLYPGRHPAYALYLTIDPSELDVNVHPAKYEVRFAEPRVVHNFISSQLKKVLQPSLSAIENYRPISPITQTQYQVYEDTLTPYRLIQSPHQPQIPVVDLYRSDNQWLMLAEGYAIFYCHQQAYLVDLLRLQKYVLKNKLQQANLPLEHRALIVPIYYLNAALNRIELASNNEERNTALATLKQLGITIKAVDNTRWAICSLPFLIPHLQIHAFLDAFFSASNHTLAHLIKLLLNAMTLDIQAETVEHYTDYMADIITNAVNNAETETVIKPLNKIFCQAIFNES